jgi:large subunit ribosomal protein L6
MSKIGKKSISIPEGVEVVVDNSVVRVKGPKWELSEKLLDGVSVAIADGVITVSVDSEEKRKFWGLYRSLIANMVVGVTEGYEKKLHIIGVGYGAQAQWQKLVLSLGYSHKIDFNLPASISGSVEQDAKGNAIVTLQSIDKQLIGQVAAQIRDLRKPEPYKGKWVRYFGEEIKLKPGKAAAK